MLEDLRFSLRLWRRNPAFAAVALLTLALGVALNTSLFGVVNAVWFRPPGFPQPDRLVFLYEFHPQKGFTRYASGTAYEDWRAHSRSFDRIGGLVEVDFALSGLGDAEAIRGAAVSPSLTAMLGFQPVCGRAFTAEDEMAGAPRVVLISQRFWERRFSSSPAVLGSRIWLDGIPVMIVGVLPHGFRLLYSSYNVIGLLRPEDWSGRSVQVVARLAPGVSLPQAREDVSAISRNLAGRLPATHAGWEGRALPIKDVLWDDAKPVYLILLAASGLLLMIICANLSGLLLARAARRGYEIAVRLALGSGRWRIARQLLVEGAALALGGGALAFLFCLWGRSAIVTAYPEMKELVMDGRVSAFTFGISLLTGLGFGLGPALAASRPDLNGALKDSASAPARNRLGSWLTAVQVALASGLLMTAGLLVRSIFEMRGADPGFRTANLLTAKVNLPKSRYPDTGRRLAFYESLLDRLSTLPGVSSAAGADAMPLMGGDERLRIEIEGRPPRPDGQFIRASFTPISRSYFRTVGAPLLHGREFTPADRDGSPRTAIVNRAFASTFWTDSLKSVHARIRVGDGPWLQIIGVAADTRQVLTRPAFPQIFVPLAQQAEPSLSFALRTLGPASAIAPALRSAIRELDPHLPVSGLETMETAVKAYFPVPIVAVLLGFSAIALALAAMGMYGVISFGVARRTHEFAVRMALGAGRSALWRLVLRDGIRLAAAGLACGLVVATLLGRALARYLYGVSAIDARVFAAVGVVLGLVTLAACSIPALRASRAETVWSLRRE